jgi:hypothetical protein
MRHRSLFPYVLAILTATLASTAAAAEDPQVTLPVRWTASVVQPKTTVSWQSPLVDGNRNAFQKGPPSPRIPLLTPAKNSRFTGPDGSTEHCTSTGPNGVVACAAMIAVATAVHSIQN